MPAFERIAIVGLGLLGGSVAAAAKQAGVAACIAGATRSGQARERALRNGWVDEVGSPSEAARKADLVVLATPVFAMEATVCELAGSLREGAIVTDVGSVKAQLAETLPGHLPSHSSYVGSHPMAGSHQRGIEHARADLFVGAPCVVSDSGDSDACRRVGEFWRALGARVVTRDPAAHDAQVAWTSHLPHVLAVAFASAFRDAPAGSQEVTGSGFRDFTRIAQSDAELWSDILTANRNAIIAPLATVSEALGELGRAVEANDTEGVKRWIVRARENLVCLPPHAPTDHLAGDGHRQNDNPNPRNQPSPPTGHESGENIE